MATRQYAHGTAPVRLLLTVPEAAEALGLGRSVIYELLLAGELTSVKIGRARRIPLATLELFVTRRLGHTDKVGRLPDVGDEGK